MKFLSSMKGKTKIFRIKNETFSKVIWNKQFNKMMGESM
jgi:hypothetical protein